MISTTTIEIFGAAAIVAIIILYKQENGSQQNNIQGAVLEVPGTNIPTTQASVAEVLGPTLYDIIQNNPVPLEQLNIQNIVQQFQLGDIVTQQFQVAPISCSGCMNPTSTIGTSISQIGSNFAALLSGQ